MKEILVPAGDDLRRKWTWWTIPGGIVPPEVQADYEKACASGVVEFFHNNDTLEFGYPIEE